MANTYTTNYNYAKPAEGDSDWDSTLNNNFDLLDADLILEHNGDGSHGNSKPLRCRVVADATARGAISSPRTGDMVWQSDTKVLYVHDGTAWQSWASVVTVLNNVPLQTQTLTDAASISWNLNSGGAATVTLAGNRTLANPTNMKSGGSYYLVVKQDATGNRTLSYGAAYKFPDGVKPVLSTPANAVDILTFISDGASMYGVAQKKFS